MTASRTIPESLHQTLTDLYGEIDPATGRRRTYPDLSRWLRDAHGVEASREAVRRLVEPLRRERAEIRREVLREKLAAQLGAQVDTLDELMAKVVGLTSPTNGKKVAAGVVLEALDMFRRAVETKARFAGVGERVEHAAGGDGEGTAVAVLSFYVPRKIDPDDGST